MPNESYNEPGYTSSYTGGIDRDAYLSGHYWEDEADAQSQDILQDPAFMDWARQNGINGISTFNGQPVYRGTESLSDLTNKYQMEQANTQRQGYIDKFNAYQQDINPDEAFQQVDGTYMYGGLPVRQDAQGNWFYDASVVAQNFGYTPEQAAQLNNDQWAYQFANNSLSTNPDEFGLDYNNPLRTVPESTFVDQNLSDFGGKDTEGALLRNLARTPVYLGTAPDLSDETMVGNIAQGRTALGYTPSGDENTFTHQQEQNLTYKPDTYEWYQPQRLVPMATIGAMGLMSGGIASGLAAPLAATAGASLGGGVAGGIASGAITGLAAGAGGSIPSAFAQGGQTGDWGGALETVGKGALSGAVTGGVLGGATSGFQAITGGGDWNGIPMAELQQEAAANGMSVEELQQILDPQNFDVLQNMGTLQQLQDAGINLGTMAPAAPGALDVFGRTATDYGHDPSTQFDSIADINNPDNYQQYIKDLYRTGNTETLSSMGFMTDSGALLGLQPSNLAIPESGVNNPFTKDQIMEKLAELYQPSAPDIPGSTGMHNYIGPYDGETSPMTSSRQAVGAGQAYDGMTVPSDFSQQFGAVRPSGLENYSQDLMSMVQESPDMLENPQIYNMLVEQLQGGGQIKRPGTGLMDDTSGMVV